MAVILQSAVDDPVAVKENGAAQLDTSYFPLWIHFVLSHFVLASFSFGCDTNKCHTTA